MKRTPLTADPAKVRAFNERGRGKLERRTKCEQCGVALRDTERFCSRPCLLAHIADEKRLPPATCVGCGSEYRPRARTQRFCCHSCAATHNNATLRRPPGACSICGAPIDPGRPSKPRMTCGPVCRSEAIARSKRSERNPTKNPAVRQKIARTVQAKRQAADADVPGTRRTVCTRPGCQRPLQRQAGKYCSPRCHYDDRARVGARAQPHHRRADWNAVELGACAHPECAARAVHRHHVVFSQHVVQAGGDKWDPANALGLCWHHHSQLHARYEFPAGELPDEAVAFAVTLLGPPRAFEYFRRRYGGAESDPRLAALVGAPA